MTFAGLSLPELSEYDPAQAGEGSLDPMGLAAISDRLADRLVPGLRARMQRVRFVTAIAVGAMVCETLTDEVAADGRSTPAICFEWLVIEAFVRRLSPQEIPSGVPGRQKARRVVRRGQRLSADTYLKGPAVFGFNGVYKPFAVDSGVVDRDLAPGPRCADLVHTWEHELDLVGFVDGVSATEGGRLHRNLREHVRNALRAGRCTTGTGSHVLGDLARSLNPGRPGPRERRALRSLITDDRHETRAELAHLLEPIGDELTEAEVLRRVRPRCSPTVAAVIDAVVAYERFAALVDVAFRTLCAVSHSMGTQPLTPDRVVGHPMISRAASDLPGAFSSALDHMAAIAAEEGLEQRLGEFAIPRPPAELVELLLAHHDAVQAAKPPGGKRSWFEPLRDGWVVRPPYGTPNPPELGYWFIHPVRIDAFRRFLEDTAP